jgi:hypothetical protein
MWIVAGVWEHVFRIGCEEETKEGKWLQLRKGFLVKEGGVLQRGEGLGGVGLGEGD